MYSTLQRLNHYGSISTTFVMVLLGLISLASFFTLPAVEPGTVSVNDLIVRRGRVNRWGAAPEELASLRFDVRADVTPLLNSYNTKQLFLYLTAAYADDVSGDTHEVVLWDRIITRSDIKDFRTTGDAEARKNRSPRPRIRMDNVKNKYAWRNPSRSFKNIHDANITLSYHLMPYVGLVTSGVAATAQGKVEIPDLATK
ncbi:putative signal peptidase [Cutaneotrichosporon oleaginosum]|uniref:Signal peptidase subunit 3 n=1 Tax=Cutaneotrichosporon oleaginosum TaxID=879819 RepID=A0A0J1B6A0_9TREE|nr:putative signal peptidase [Cutaneotrichosporon oleaginosum]KLT43249.1 putative signal peptidase [Cutaneotrichosporon oleaginosum]TXT09928.1 hypothetical protein COLE_03862 [Cutaneotrichosporon oleaginosum]